MDIILLVENYDHTNNTNSQVLNRLRNLSGEAHTKKHKNINKFRILPINLDIGRTTKFGTRQEDNTLNN